MKNFTLKLIGSFLLLMVAFTSYGQEVIKTAKFGIGGTTTPGQKFEVSGVNNTIRIGGLVSGGTYNPILSSATSASNLVYANNVTGDLYAIPGSTGAIFSISSGIPTWISANAAITTNNLGKATGSSVVVGNGIGVVVGSSAVTIDVQGSAGGIFYGEGSGTSAAFLSAGPSGNFLVSNGGGIPNWEAVGYWSLSGNAGTNPAVNFIGTTNDLPLIFATNNTGSVGTIASTAYAGQIDPQFIGATLKGNVYMGEGSSSNIDIGAGNNDAGNYNVGIGCAVLGLNTTGVGNVALSGFAGLSANTTGSYNISVNRNLRFNLNGNGNIALGYFSLTGLSGTASYNTAIGYQAGYAYAGPGNNTGTATNGIGNFNTAVGYDALYINAITNATANTALGNYAAYISSGNKNTALGDSALVANTSGSNNTGLGYQSNVTSGALSNATAIGYQATVPVSNSLVLGSNSVAYNAISSAGIYMPGYNSTGSLFYTSAANGQVAPLASGTSGYFLQSNGGGAAPSWANVSVTSGTVSNVTGSAPITVNGTWNINIQGTNANQGGILYSAGAGNSAVFTSTGTSGQELMSNGAGAPTWGTAVSATWNTKGNTGTTPGTNFIGTTDDKQFRFQLGGIYGGSLDPQLVGATTFGNIYLGAARPNNSFNKGAGNVDAGTYNIGYGQAALGNSGAGSYNVALNELSMAAASATGSYNVAMNVQSLMFNDLGNGNIAIGMTTLFSNGGTSSYNTAIGDEAGVGAYLATYNANGQFNTALTSNYWGNGNSMMGWGALMFPTINANANSNTAIGYEAEHNTYGAKNTAAGDSALFTNSTGIKNTALGYAANVSTGTLTSAIAIGYQSTVTINNTITLGNSAVAGGNTSATTTGLYIPGSGYNTVGSLFYVAAPSGLISSLVPGTSGNFLQSNGPGSAPTWANVATGPGSVTTVTGSAPVIITGAWQVNIQGTAGDKGGVLYSAGAGVSAAFTTTPASAGLVLTSGAAGAAPSWQPLANAAWNLTGNTGTTPGTNFIGTTDANRLDFKVGTTIPNCGTIDLPTTAGAGNNGNAYLGWATSYENAGVATSGTTMGDAGTNNTAFGWASYPYVAATTGGAINNVAVGHQALADVSGSATIASGSYNVVGGYAGLIGLSTGNGNVMVVTQPGTGATVPKFNIRSGSYNTGFGYLNFSNVASASASNAVGSYNVAAGFEALQSAAVSATNIISSNTGIGYLALQNAQYSKNVAVGSSALNSNTTGGFNTAIGDSALFNTNTTGTYVTGFGALSQIKAAGLTNATTVGALADDSLSNTLVLGSVKNHNGATTNISAGIGTNVFPTDAVLAVKTGHIETQGQLSVGNVFADAGAGTGGSLGVTITSATDVGGTISFTTGAASTPTSGQQVTVFFSTPYQFAPIISITPGNAAAAAAMTVNGAYVTASTSSFTINFVTAPLANTTYNFNYFAVETPGTATAQSGTSCNVPITLTNGTATAVAAGTTSSNGFQQMITVNSSTYASLESAGLMNVEFTSGNPASSGGTPLNAWLESGNTTAATNTVYWVNLGTTSIPANSSITIYMNFMPTSIMSASGPTGEAPTLSSSYAAYDNGSSVFNNYWNFAGTSIPAGLTQAVASGTIVYNNGVTITPVAATAWGTYVVTSTKIAVGNVAESYFTQNTYPNEQPTYAQALMGGMIADVAQTLTGNNASYAGTLDLQTSQDGLTVPLNAWNYEIQDAYNQHNYPYPVIGVESALFGTNIWSLGINPAGTLGFGDINYTNLVSGGSAAQNLSGGFYIGFSLTQGAAFYQWLRTRTYPPTGIMPTVGFGSSNCTAAAQPTESNVCYVPITLTNGQSITIPAGVSASTGYQQMLNINSYNYASYENAGLQNVEFSTGPAGTGTVLNSWLESGNSNTSTSSIYWLNLGTTGIPANSSATIYMNFMTTNVMVASGSSGPVGEAPQLSSTYAQFDDGSLVFNKYWNFAGSSTPAGITTEVNISNPSSTGTAGAVTFNNGATVTQGNNWGTFLVTTSTVGVGNVAESYLEQETYPLQVGSGGTAADQAMLAGIVTDASQTLAQSALTSYAATVDFPTANNGSGVQISPLNAYYFEIQQQYNQHNYPYPVLGYTPATNNGFNICSLGINTAGNLGFGDFNYTNLVPGGSTAVTLSNYYVALQTTQNKSFFQWLRVRTYPPNGVMPGTTSGSIICQ